MSTTTNATAIPIPGTPAYWTAQREAVALLHAYNFGLPDLFVELDVLRQIAAHGFAARMMAAQGDRLPDLLSNLERIAAAIEADDEDADVADPDAPPYGEDFCPRGCQILYGMECGMCGYEGPGVKIGEVDTVAEYCCHCKARTYQSLDSICELCGKHAETPDEAAPQAALCFGECGPVSTDTQCALCRNLEHHARSAAAETAPDGLAASGLATAAALARTALTCSGGPRVDSSCP